tara:strand:+ start:2215 stop:2499 length:285 start_codon:yes stop_codon:yes gene_type:complete
MSRRNDIPELLMPVKKENELKKWLVNYVGDKLQPENDEVNVEMIIQVIAEEFPEFLLPVAEENFIRGYQQAINDTVKNTPGIKKNEGIHSRKLT